MMIIKQYKIIIERFLLSTFIEYDIGCYLFVKFYLNTMYTDFKIMYYTGLQGSSIEPMLKFSLKSRGECTNQKAIMAC